MLDASFSSFVSAAGRHWLVLMSGGLITVALGLFERISGKNVPLWVYAGILVFFIFLACYLAWKEERTKRTNDQTSTIEPSLKSKCKMIHGEQNTKLKPDQIFREVATGHLEIAAVEIENTLHHVDLKVSDIDSVKAQIFFRPNKGTENYDLIRGTWMETDLTWVDFHVGKPRKLIVAVRSPEGVTHAVQTDYVDLDYDPDQSFDPQYRELKDDSYSVMLQLIAGNERGGRLVGRFMFKLRISPSFEIEASE